jgi:hypothetical protein
MQAGYVMIQTRAVAEGWEWARIQSEACPQCGYAPAGLPVAALGRAATVEAAAWRSFLENADRRALAVSPAPDVWSPLQYAAHVRDMYRVFGDRVLLALEFDNPTVPGYFPTEDECRAYNSLDAREIAAQIGNQADRLASILADRVGDDWARTVMRDGVDRFTVAGLGCFAVHEAHHHLRDATGGLLTPAE